MSCECNASCESNAELLPAGGAAAGDVVYRLQPLMEYVERSGGQVGRWHDETERGVRKEVDLNSGTYLHRVSVARW